LPRVTRHYVINCAYTFALNTAKEKHLITPILSLSNMVKVQFKSTTRKLSLSTPSFAAFQTAIAAAFNIQHFDITYVDSDNDVITIGSDEELQDALNEGASFRVVEAAAPAQAYNVSAMQQDEDDVADNMFATREVDQTTLHPLVEDEVESEDEDMYDNDKGKQPAKETTPTEPQQQQDQEQQQQQQRGPSISQQAEELAQRYQAMFDSNPDLINDTEKFMQNVMDSVHFEFRTAFEDGSRRCSRTWGQPGAWRHGYRGQWGHCGGRGGSSGQGRCHRWQSREGVKERYERDSQTLKDMGFQDEARIKDLWERYGGNLDRIIDVLTRQEYQY